MPHDYLIQQLRQDLIDSLISKIECGGLLIRLFHVNENLTYNLNLTKLAADLKVSIKVKEIDPQYRYIVMDVSFDKYVKEIILYVSPKYSITYIVETLSKKCSDVVRDTFIENNDLQTVHNINKQFTLARFNFTSINLNINE